MSCSGMTGEPRALTDTRHRFKSYRIRNSRLSGGHFTCLNSLNVPPNDIGSFWMPAESPLCTQSSVQQTQCSFLTWVHLGTSTPLYFFLSFLVFPITFIYWIRVFKNLSLHFCNILKNLTDFCCFTLISLCISMNDRSLHYVQQRPFVKHT